MQKYLPFALSIILMWASSCDHDESKLQQVSAERKITITDLEHEPAVKDLLSKVQGSSANGRISSLEITDAFFKYSEPDSGILNYTFRLPDDSPDYFENLVLSQYEDGFYGFIYRYIPDDIYSMDGDFKGILQLYNLENELIQELRIPFEADSAYAGGRTQLVSPCIKGVEQNCVTMYEVKTVTDYPCHCQYESKTKVGKVCTVSLKKGWCDETVAAPPAGGGGTFVSVPGEEPHGGGGGGGGKTPPKKNPVVLLQDDGYDDINYDKVKSPCLVGVIRKLMREDFKNKINAFAKHRFIDAEQYQNLDFKETPSIVNDNNEPVHARTMPRYLDENRNTHIEIRLNASTLPGTSELFQTVAIYHETMHAVLRLSEGFDSLSMKEQHKEMAASYMVQFMLDGVSEIYGRKLLDSEIRTVAALWLYTTSHDAAEAQQFKDSLTKWNLTIDSIIEISEKEENTVRDKGTGKIKSIGGRNCI